MVLSRNTWPCWVINRTVLVLMQEILLGKLVTAFLRGFQKDHQCKRNSFPSQCQWMPDNIFRIIIYSGNICCLRRGSRIEPHSTFLRNGDPGKSRDLSKSCAQFQTTLIKKCIFKRWLQTYLRTSWSRNVRREDKLFNKAVWPNSLECPWDTQILCPAWVFEDLLTFIGGYLW